MAKIAITTISAIFALITIITAAVAGVVSAVLGAANTAGSQPSPTALADIPADYLALYQHAAPLCPGLDWAVLAAIGKIETNHGRHDAPGVHDGENVAGAGGPMQFLAPTFDRVIEKHPLPLGGASPPSRYHPHDAIHAAAFYLCDSGARHGDLHSAIYAYCDASVLVADHAVGV